MKLNAEEQRFWDMTVASMIAIQAHPANKTLSATDWDQKLKHFADVATAAINQRRLTCRYSPE